MLVTLNYQDFVPQIVPQNMNGTITSKIRLNGHERTDKTHSIYVQLYQDRKNRKINLNISVPKKSFDKKKQRIKSNFKYFKDYNLIIEKVLADINEIEVQYRLQNDDLTLDVLIENLKQPSLRVNYNEFFEKHLEYQLDKGIIQHSTYKQQKASLSKIRKFKDPLYFAEINEDFLAEFRSWLKTKMNNKPATVEIAIKNFKKYLHIANDKGIRTPLVFNKVKIKQVKGNITFLLPEEVKRLYQFYNNEYTHPTWKNVLQRYLFSCFTGLRISDIEKLTENNFVDNILVFTATKTNKLQRVKLNQTALSLIELPHIFNGQYEQQTINKELKHIAKAVGIKKRLYFHSSRHTFATNYLIAGGQIRNLQKLLGHSELKTTETYAHVVDSIMHKEIGLLDGIIN